MTVRRRLLGFTLTFLIATASALWAQELPERRLGDRPPTPAEQAYIDAVYTEVTRVAPNDLARARLWAEIDAAVARGERAPAPDGLPTVVDNSTLQCFPPIDSQGGQGSCTCWAACYYYNTYTQAVDEGYDVSGGDPDHICSPGFMYPLVNGGVDEGAVTQFVVARLNDVGCSSWTLKPYSDGDWTSWPSEPAWIQALDNRTQSAHIIDGSTQSGLDAIKQHLANGNVAVTRFDVYTTWHIYYPDNSKTGIDNDVYYYPGGAYAGGHAVTLVGYDDNKSYVDHRDAQTHYGAFLVANSWGNGWGVQNSTGSGTNGFFWVAYDMFLETTFGPSAYYNDDRDDYRPSLYAVVGVNHPQRAWVRLDSEIVASPSWYSYPTIWNNGGTQLGVTDTDRIAVDMSDGISYIPTNPPTTVGARIFVDSNAASSGTVTSAEFYEDFDGDSSYVLHSSTDPTVTITPGNSGYAYAVIHDFSVTAFDPIPSTVASGASTSLSAAHSDSESHGIASWSWSEVPTVDSELIGSLVGGIPQALAIENDYVYCAADAALAIFDASDPSQLQLVGSYHGEVEALDVEVSGTRAYLIDKGSLRIIDVADPQGPTELGSVYVPGVAQILAFSGTYVYASSEWAGLRVIDVSTPGDPFLLGVCDTPQDPHEIVVSGSYAYVADGSSGLRVINVSDPMDPVEVGVCDTPGSARGVVLCGTYAFVADDTGDLRVIDVSTPTTPTEVGSLAMIMSRS